LRSQADDDLDRHRPFAGKIASEAYGSDGATPYQFKCAVYDTMHCIAYLRAKRPDADDESHREVAEQVAENVFYNFRYRIRLAQFVAGTTAMVRRSCSRPRARGAGHPAGRRVRASARAPDDPDDDVGDGSRRQGRRP
jgi:hypothetical protein